MQWRKRLKLQYVVGSLKGSHLIRVYRLFFTEELSHITIKRRDGQRTKSNEHYESSRENSSQYSRPDRNNKKETEESQCSVSDVVKVPEDLIENIYWNHEAQNGEINGQPDFHFNGLWFPGSEVQSPDVSQVLPNIFHTVPVLVNHPSSPSTCPRIKAFHSPEVSFHPNYFVPNNHHYFYYLTRLQTKPLEDQPMETSNFCPNSSDYPGHPIPPTNESATDEHLASAESLTPIAETASNFGVGSTSSSGGIQEDNQCTPHQVYLTNVPFESPNDMHAAYRFPGYGFGHPVQNIPLCVLFPPTDSQPIPSSPTWSMVHLQKRRRRRRKGYAEYAVIPRKKNVSQTSSNEPTEILENDLKDSTKGNKLNTAGRNSREKSKDLKGIITNGEYCLPSSNTEQSKCVESLDKNTKGEYTLIFASNEVLLYVNDFVEKITQQAIQISQNQFMYCRIVGEDLDDTISITTTSCKDVESSSVIVKENVYSISNQIVDESNTQLTSFADLNCVKKIYPELEKRNGDYLNKEERHHNSIKSAHLKDITIIPDKDSLQNGGSCSFSCASVTTNTEPISDSCEAENNNICLKASLKMSVPRVHKKIISGSLIENENNPPYKEPKSKMIQDIRTETKLNCDISNHNDVSDQSSSIFDNNVHGKMPATDYTEQSQITNTNFDNLGFLSRNQSCDKPETSYFNSSADSAERTNFTEACMEIVPSENRYSRSQALHSELNENQKHTNDSPSSPCSFVSHSVSSEVLIRETEIELNKLHQLTANSNQSIYKLAYDENSSDQSETEDLDVIDLVREKTHSCPQSCKNLQGEVYRSEILVHEVDSASDAGSEDVELLPHRYESDTAKGCNKHVYVNNLSLAVELLRTRESLPYDDEFKRIISDEVESKIDGKGFRSVELKPMVGMVNLGFVEDLATNSNERFDTISLNNNPKFTHQTYSGFPQASSVVQDKPQHREFRPSVADSGVQSEVSEDEVGEEAKETFAKRNETLYSSNADANYHGFGAQPRQRFSIYTRRANVMNPCFCCTIM